MQTEGGLVMTASTTVEPGTIQVVSIMSIRPAPENDDVYGVVSRNDPDIAELAKSIKQHGLREPILISTDGFIISGHRRRTACLIAKLDHVPVRVEPISRTKNHAEFVKLLVEMNSQRIKSASVLVRETMVKVDPKAAHQQIKNERLEKESKPNLLSEIDPYSDGKRCKISAASMPLLNAIIRVLNEQRDYWPISARQIHYRLLGPDAPLKHASKPDSTYVNNQDSYKKLISVLARGRTEGRISWNAVEDETRPVEVHEGYWNTAEFLRSQIENFLKGYWRHRQQSQPSHIEIVGEKLTVHSILKSVAQEYTIPLTIARGMASLPCKKAIANRFFASKKKKLVLLVVSDLDPAGDAIAEDLVKCFRRDFRIVNIDAYKVALTIEQVEELELEPSMDAKESSPTYQAFVDTYGITDAYELEAMQPSDLEQSLKDAIEEVMDLDAYNQELEAEETDSAEIVAVQKQVQQFLSSLKLDHGEVSE
jgi:hypothetical protein